MRILVTRAFGFIGTALVHHLAQDGHDAIALTTRPTRDVPSHVPVTDVVHGSLLDEKPLSRALRGSVGVVHLGALTRVRESFERESEYLAVNVEGTAALFRAAELEMKHSGRPLRFVFASPEVCTTLRPPTVRRSKRHQTHEPIRAVEAPGRRVPSCRFAGRLRFIGNYPAAVQRRRCSSWSRRRRSIPNHPQSSSGRGWPGTAAPSQRRRLGPARFRTCLRCSRCTNLGARFRSPWRVPDLQRRLDAGFSSRDHQGLR